MEFRTEVWVRDSDAVDYLYQEKVKFRSRWDIYSETAGKGPMRNVRHSVKGRRARTAVLMSERRVLQEKAPGNSHCRRLQ